MQRSCWGGGIRNMDWLYFRAGMSSSLKILIPSRLLLLKQLIVSICCVASSIGGSLRQMAKNAVEWARKKGLHRTNPVHGSEEFRVPTMETFEHSGVERTTTTASSSTELEAAVPACSAPPNLVIDFFFPGRVPMGCCLVMRPS